MRNVISQHWQQMGRQMPSHPGLAYDVWAPVLTSPQAAENERGKVPDGIRGDWLEQLAAIPIASDYAGFYQRWQSSLAGERAGIEQRIISLTSRLLVGHGHVSPTGVGLTVHHTWGVPVIPGSALKGLLNHYIDIVYGPDPDADTRDPEKCAHPMVATDERAAFQGVTWRDRRIVQGPGAIHRALFGAPAADRDRRLETAGGKLLELTASRGLVVFHDALFVPGSVQQPFAVDVLTVHQKRYYDKKGAELPNDYDSPNPVGFLSVRPKTKLLLAISGPAPWRRFAMRHLLAALQEWGVGAKTAAGYGRAKATQEADAAEQPTPHLLAELQRWLQEPQLLPDGSRMGQKQQLEQLGSSSWLLRLRSLPAEQREEVARLLRRTFSRQKQAEARDALITRLGLG